MTTGRAPDVARGPRALRNGQEPSTKARPSVERRGYATSDGPPDLRVAAVIAQRWLSRASDFPLP